MRLSALFIVAGAFVCGGLISLVTAYFSVQMIESASESEVLNELDREGLTWAEVDTNGLQVFLIGTAPDEARRFQALSTAGRVVDAARVIDQMLIEESEGLAPPRFSLEILRNESRISVIGLIPSSSDREALVERFNDLAGDGEVSDLLEAADFPAPEGWERALSYASSALSDLPRSKISVEAGRVAIKAMTDSPEAKQRLETSLARRAPDNLVLAVEVSAPRPVITPYTLRFVIDESGARFDSCSADTEQTRDRILRAASQAGLEGKATCMLGLGVPSRRWADAAELSISKLAELGGGDLTFNNADIQLVALEGTSPAIFDRVIGELEAGLPEVFALNAVLPKPPEVSEDGPAEFTATRSPEGAVQIRGKLGSEVSRQTADSFARAAFGSGNVYTAARVDEDLPSDWSVRALAGLEALSMLGNGAVTVTAETITISGKSGRQEAPAEIAALLSEKLGDEATFDINVAYEKKLDETLGLPTPEECEAQITEVIGDRKITFEPGSATLDASAKDILDELAELLKKCGDIPLQIAGHTDSQGRESMNQQLSQQRAQSVLDALRGRLVPVKAYTAVGFGEAEPIADNDSEEGREANRRIEFKLLKPDPIEEVTTTLEQVEQQTGADEDAAAEGTGNE
ncbi:OmpA family protein [Thalassococcus lentus]|uniref:OmpA family protein n=1 Tax=Thalassococcus lentus TaxID=1210524 RepID=A0ABT4XWT1_9RHOB|nr:OmpA family protein [Thalassococcus lentus]MDA7426414.1 OmpA family protein [Thalassococcus lentus]